MEPLNKAASGEAQPNTKSSKQNVDTRLGNPRKPGSSIDSISFLIE